jgi:hypothetical protein
MAHTVGRHGISRLIAIPVIVTCAALTVGPTQAQQNSATFASPIASQPAPSSGIVPMVVSM